MSDVNPNTSPEAKPSKPGDKYFSFNLTVQDKVVLAVGIFILSLVANFLLMIFYVPQWTARVIETNERVSTYLCAHEPLVLIGGGTVNEYMKSKGLYKNYYARRGNDTASINVVGVPSLFACKTLRGELEHNNLGWIVMSAARAEPGAFMDKTEEVKFKESKCIVEVFLGRDRLTVLTSANGPLDSLAEGKNISYKNLRSFLQRTPEGMNVYATTVESGTRTSYNDAMGYKIPETATFFNPETPISMGRDAGPTLVLCSEEYRPKALSPEHKAYFVTDSLGNVVQRDIMLYCIGHTDKKSGKVVIRSPRVKEFIQSVKAGFDVDNISDTGDLVIRDPDPKARK